ncbi:MAG: RNA polymerase factor sigma-54 [Nitrospirae bacterium]|nr:RNA polymerase factor sigma-54 [Candidatus Troglogloeales bacterium]MBI3598035.1 RNA polymerase factor sigma-54 [Candidatus Troglogloeales bacterium]
MNTRIDLRLGQRMVMTPQLQQAIKLLALSRLELNQIVDLEMTENPILEELSSDTPEDESLDATGDNPKENDPEKSDEIDLKWEDSYEDDDRERIESDITSETPPERPSYDQTLATPISLSDHLLWQLGLISLSEKEQEIGAALIGNIEDHGYLETSLEEIAGSVGTPVSRVENILKVVQRFDPPGVGARNLSECLLIQIELLSLSGSLVETIIKNHLADIEKRRYAQIAKECGVLLEEVLQASKIIEHLEPKPGRPFYASDNFNIIPDVFVVKLENDEERGGDGGTGGYAVILNDDGLPKMKISSYYRSLLRSKQPGEETTRAYLKEKFQSAMWLIRSIDQRNQTILKVANSILKFQYAFMEKGVGQLKPLVLKQVAEDISMHESTVSRVTTHKYIHTPQGIFELKYFFNGSLASVGGNTDQRSSLAVREQIGRIVSEEDAVDPLTDQEIVNQLKKEGVEMARRTVSKYRAELKIAPATKRRRPG